MRVLGIDHGDRHIGLALSDPLLVTARPLGSYEPTGRENLDRQYFRDLVAEHDVGLIVVGDPIPMDGSRGTIAYGGGYAAGTFISMKVEERLSLDTVVLRVISPDDVIPLVVYLRQRSFGVTIADGEGSKGKVKIILSVIKRQDLDEVITAIREYLPKAFYSVEEIKSVADGVFPEKRSSLIFNHRDPFGIIRKGK